MQILMSLFMLLLIGSVMAALFTFGFALFLWFMIVATLLSVYAMLRQAWFRHKGGVVQSSQSIEIIEGEYKDVSGD